MLTKRCDTCGRRVWRWKADRCVPCQVDRRRFGRDGFLSIDGRFVRYDHESSPFASQAEALAWSANSRRDVNA